jgi:tetratricopeptide (TPR) repeat protein/transcriptional regulator with XRE-family HTH domain
MSTHNFTRLRDAREAYGWSQQDLADKVRVTKLTVSRWENNKSIPHRHYRRLLSELFPTSQFQWDMAKDNFTQDIMTGETQDIDTFSSQTVDTNIPNDNSLLVGREALLSSLCDQLQHGSRGLTLTTALNGLPGVGKTRMATAICYLPQIREHFSDGILWAPVGPNSQIMGILHHWGEILGMTEAQRQSLHTQEEWTQTIKKMISQKKMLIVIDDVWLLEDAIALAVGGEMCTHLVTTRFPIIAAQLSFQAISVQELSEDESCQLLGELAPATQNYPTQLRLLARAVGGLPLALTLIGNYLRIQSYAGSKRRISHAFNNLMSTPTRLTIAEPHIPAISHPSLVVTQKISLDTIIRVSEDRLSPNAKRAFYLLALFPPKPNSFSESAALALIEDDYTVLDELFDFGFIECSISEGDGSDRYRLHQVLSDYGHLRLEQQIPTEQKQEAVHRLLMYATQFLKTNAANYERLDLEYPTLEATFDIALKLGLTTNSLLVQGLHDLVPYLILRGMYNRAEKYLQAIHPYQMTEEQRIRQCLLSADVAAKQSRFEQAEEQYRTSLILAREHQLLYSQSLVEFSGMQWKRGYLQEAQKMLNEAQQTAISEMEQCKIAKYLGAIANQMGDGTTARDHLKRALDLAQKYKLRDQVCTCYLNLGTVEGNLGNRVAAKDFFLKALAVAKEIKYTEQLCVILINLAYLHRQEGTLETAVDYLQEALTTARQMNSPEWLSVVLCDLASVNYALSQPEDEVEMLYKESLSIARQVNRARVTCNVCNEYGSFLLDRLAHASEGMHDITEQYEKARLLFQECLDLAQGNDLEMTARAFYGLARVAAGRQQFETAHNLASQSSNILGQMQHYELPMVENWIRQLKIDQEK